MKVTDRIIGPARGSVGAATAFAERAGALHMADVRAYLTEVYRLAPLVGMDPAIIVSQSAHETGNWRSPAWVSRLNPAGLGITDGPDFGFGWQTGTDAARAQIVHMACYVAWDIEFAGLFNNHLDQHKHLDLRRQAVFDAGFAGTVRTIADLTGKWATDRQYHAKVAAKGNAIFPGISDQQEAPMADLVFGNVKHPPYQDRYIPDAQNGAWDYLGQRTPLGIVQHSMVGSLMGTDGWFRRGSASNGLTDYGIGGSTDGALDGVIFRWNDPRGHRSGWANGTTDGLEGDGVAFVRSRGIAAVNRDLVSIERSDGGNTTTPMSPKQFESICQLTAYWFDQARVPYTTFPRNPALNLITYFFHYEFATKTCPHPPVVNRVNEIQDRVRAILTAAQTRGMAEPPPVDPPAPPPPRWPKGWDEARLAKRWGEIPQIEPGGTTKVFGWQPEHAVINAWVARGAADEERTDETDLQRPLVWQRVRGDADQVVDLIIFQSETTDRAWCLFRPAVDVRWTWAN